MSTCGTSAQWRWAARLLSHTESVKKAGQWGQVGE